MTDWKEYEKDLAIARKQEGVYNYAIVDAKGRIVENFRLQCTAAIFLRKSGNKSLKLIKLNSSLPNIKL